MSSSSRSALFYSPPEIKKIEDIESQGKPMEPGSLGRPYRIGNEVYKIYYDITSRSANIPEILPGVQRTARYFNKIKQEIHNQEFKLFPSARVVTYPDKYGRNYAVLITPFIEGECIGETEIKEFDEAMKQLGMGMLDKTNRGNIRREKTSGKLFAIDCDNVFTLHDKNGPPSPLSKRFRKAAPQRNYIDNLPNRDKFGFRSYFMLK